MHVYSHFVAFVLKAKLLTKAVAAKGTSTSPNAAKKFKVLNNKPKKPELFIPSTIAASTVAIPSIHSSVVSENKQEEESTRSNVTNKSTRATPATSIPESCIHFDVEITSCAIKRKAEDSESVQPKSKQMKLLSYFILIS